MSEHAVAAPQPRAPSSALLVQMPDASSASAVVGKFSSIRVVIVGDVMLDQYVIGEVHRVSPEAPVPVVEVGKTTKLPGGAGNVAANIASLGASPHLIGLIGNDPPGEDLKAVMSRMGVLTAGLVASAGRPTSMKTRIVAGQQQICRIDHESRHPANAAEEQSLMDEIDRCAAHADVWILSDYGKGALPDKISRRVISCARKSNKPVVVDPKVRHFRKYAGCTVIAPNTREAEAATGRTLESADDMARAANMLHAASRNAAILITQGAQGMTLFEKGRPPFHTAAHARRVFDVSGAGDTVVSALALSIAAGADLRTSVLLANTAAGVVVQKPGTAQVTPGEILAGAARHATRARALTAAS